MPLRNTQLNKGITMKNVISANTGTTKKGNQMTAKNSADLSVSTGIEEGQTLYVKGVVFSFRPQPLVDDEGNTTKLEGVDYIDHETDRNGNVVYEEDGVTPKQLFSRKKPATKRLPVALNIVYPLLATFGITATPAFVDGAAVYENKSLQLIQDQIESVVESEARALLDQGKIPTAEDLDFNAIAAKPKAQRASSSRTIDKDSLVAAIESFAAAMIALGKQPRGVDAQVKLFKSRCKGADQLDAGRLGKMSENWATWFAGLSEDAQQDHVDAFEFIADKLEKAALSEFDLDEIL